MKWSQGLCASILLDGFYSFSPRPRLDPRRGQDFPAAPVGPVFAPNGFAADWGLPPRLGAATPRASPQFTSELAIERQHYGLVGDLLAGVEEGDSAAREDTTIDGKKAVDSQAMGGCNTKLSPDGEKFVYIDCAVSNSKKASFKFRITNITDVVRAFAP